jgi:cysteine sulfinate desulfinase/cysteine desulfurase-like protein
MGVSPRVAASSVRFSLSRFTTEQEVEQAGKLVAAAVAEIRRTT